MIEIRTFDAIVILEMKHFLTAKLEGAANIILFFPQYHRLDLSDVSIL